MSERLEETLGKAVKDSSEAVARRMREVIATRVFCETCGQALPADGGPLGNFLRSKRTALHLSLRDVERITDGSVSNAYLSQLETGKIADPSATMLLRLCAALALDIDDVLSIIDPTYLTHQARP